MTLNGALETRNDVKAEKEREGNRERGREIEEEEVEESKRKEEGVLPWNTWLHEKKDNLNGIEKKSENGKILWLEKLLNFNFNSATEKNLNFERLRQKFQNLGKLKILPRSSIKSI